MDKMIKCPRCNRTQPESLGACDWCEDERQARAEELAREEYGLTGKEEGFDL